MVTLVSRLALVLLLIVSPLAVAGLSHFQGVTGAISLITVANLDASECDHCDGCSEPCVVPVVCNSPCAPIGLALSWTEKGASKASPLRSTEVSRFRSVVIRAPIPPPRFIHSV